MNILLIIGFICFLGFLVHRSKTQRQRYGRSRPYYDRYHWKDRR